MHIKRILTVLFFSLLLSTPALAYWVWSPEEGKFINPDNAVDDSAEEQYNYAMQFFKEANLDEAVKQFSDLLQKHPSAPIAPEAQYRLGTIYEEQGEYVKAFESYKTLVESYPQSERMEEVVEREYRIGNLFLSGQKGKLMGLKILPSLPQAIKIFDHIVQNAPYSAYGDKAQFRLGMAYRKAGKFEDSIKAFERLIEQYPQSELVPEARFQLADTSFQRSAVEFRDQRALDDASQQVDHFLTRHPDAQTSEKAARLRQEIDEKNAEKNYRIGVYYEKINYLNSALIYYADVARRYPHTQWGEKAADKLSAMKSPAEFMTKERGEIESQLTLARSELSAVPEDNKLERDRAKRRVERLEQRLESLEKNKKENLESKRKDIKRQEAELRDKFKKLAAKEKLFKKNPSEDLKNALERWRASLEDEQSQLLEQKRELADWHHQLGVSEGFSWAFLPFVGEPATQIEKVRAIEAEKFYKVSNQKKDLLSEKELLYKQHGEVVTQMKQLGLVIPELENLQAKGVQGLEGTEVSTKALQEEMESLQKQLKTQTDLYEKHYGKGWRSWVGASAGLVGKSVSLINPFDSKGESLESLSLEQLLERKMHLQEKLAAQKGLVDTLSQAFDTELAAKERERLMKNLESGQKLDPAEMRKEIRKTEKQLRGNYEEIKDRHATKRKLLAELEEIVKKSEEEQTGMALVATQAAKPVTGILRMTKAFFVGLPSKDVTLPETAGQMSLSPEDEARVEQIQKQLEEESLIIEIRNQEIPKLHKELEILKAKASLGGGYKFRSAFVELPYSFLREAVDSANRLVPKKDREETLIHMLDKESQEFETLKAESNAVNQMIQQKGGQGESPVPVKSEPVLTASEKTAETAPDANVPTEASLKKSIQSLSEQLEIKQKSFQQQRAVMDTQKRAINTEMDQVAKASKWEDKKESVAKEEKDLRGELDEIQKSLKKLIALETELEQEEVGIIKKRMDKIDDLLKKALSKAMVSDLTVERERLAERLNQIELRQSFLSQENQRLNFSEPVAKP